MASICKWSGRVLGTLLVIIVIAIAIGEGIPNPFTQPPLVQYGFFAFGLILLGILAGWKWEVAGGLVSLMGWFLFLPLTLGSQSGIQPFFITLALPGTLYLASKLIIRCHEDDKIP